MEQKSFICRRKYLFWHTYHLRITSQYILLSRDADFVNPKYKIPVTLSTQLLWKVHKGRLEAFGIFHKGRIKYFNANHTDLEEIKNSLQGRVVYRNLASFYTPVELIGEGSTGKVFKCIGRQEERAIKMIYKQIIEEQHEQIEQIVKNEVVLLKTLSHRNIIKIYEVFENDGTLWIVLELAEGKALSKIKLEREEIRWIMKELLETIEYMSGMGIVHKDIKPENIIVNSQTMKLIDFGIAQSVDAKAEVTGTVGYHAPELLKSQQLYRNSDVYSAGVVFFNMLFKETFSRQKLVEYSNRVDYSTYQLLTRLLEQDPLVRPSASQALQHGFFDDSIDEGEKHELRTYTSKSMKSQHTKAH